MLTVREGTGIYFEVEPDKLLRYFSEFFPFSNKLHMYRHHSST